MTLRAKFPRALNVYNNVYNPKGKYYFGYLCFSVTSMTFLLMRSGMIRSMHAMPLGYYFDPESEYAPKLIKID